MKTDLENLVSALRHLRHRRHEVLFLHVLAPEEEEFPFTRASRFRNLENTGQVLRVNPNALRAAYLEKFRAFRQGLIEALRAMNADYHRVSTGQTPAEVLFDYLAARSGRGRSAASREGASS